MLIRAQETAELGEGDYDLSSLSFKRDLDTITGLESVGLETERELKFLLPMTVLEDIIAESDLKPLSIRQWYFPRVSEESLLNYIFDSEERSQLLASEEFSYARLRRIASPMGEDRYYVQAKFRNSDGSDLELSKPIENFALIEHFISQSDGAISKLRFVIPGVAFDGERVSSQVKAEIDLILDPRCATKVDTELPDFLTCDVELPPEVSNEDFRSGRHSFEFLKKALELSSDDNQRLRKKLRNKRIARKGYDPEAQQAVSKGLERARAKAA